jgi:Zn finger protein HypA/HybF involved in hydrogenase expression
MTEEIDEEISKLSKERDSLLEKAQDLTEELEILLEKKYEDDNTKEKIVCLACNGKGYEQRNDGSKVLCQLCGGHEYIWADIYER